MAAHTNSTSGSTWAAAIAVTLAIFGVVGGNDFAAASIASNAFA